MSSNIRAHFGAFPVLRTGGVVMPRWLGTNVGITSASHPRVYNF
jgi:hypothetical protein